MKLFISVFNRSDYVKQSLESLAESFDEIVPTAVITDDGSTDEEIPRLLASFKEKFPKTIIETNEKNIGLPLGKLNTIYEHIEFDGYDEDDSDYDDLPTKERLKVTILMTKIRKLENKYIV